MYLYLDTSHSFRNMSFVVGHAEIIIYLFIYFDLLILNRIVLFFLLHMTFLEPNITDINLDTTWSTGTFINRFVTGIFNPVIH